MINRRNFLKKTGMSTIGLLTCSASQQTSAVTQKPNILFISIDDLKPLMGAYGVSNVKTPNMDQLAASGLTFTNCHCQMTLCLPSRTSLMTGLRPDTTQVITLQTPFRQTIPDAWTLPQHFKSHGYWTQAIGKIYRTREDDPPAWSTPWTGGPQRPWYLNKNSETLSKIRLTKLTEASVKGLKGEERRQYLDSLERIPFYEDAFDVPDDAYGDGARCQAQIDCLRKLAKKPQPFFLAAGFIRPHLPFVAPKKYWDMYNLAELKLPTWDKAPIGAPPYVTQPSWELRNYGGIPLGTAPIPDDIEKKLLHGYYACTSYIDSLVGKLLNELEILGLADNTIVCLWSDQGWHLGDHGMWSKLTLFEQATRSPLIIRIPNMKNVSRQCAAPVELVDVYPTLCTLANLPIPEGLEGADASLFFNNPQAHWDKPAFTQFSRKLVNETSNKKYRVMGYSLRTERYRYTEWVHNPNWNNFGNRWHPMAGNTVLDRELYDYEVDPDETHNLINAPHYNDIQKMLAKKMNKGPKRSQRWIASPT
jgi:arylsulfatase A-like enzyme